MSAPAGPCEWCGGPQEWTIIRDEMYVRCLLGCLPLDLEGLVPLPSAARSSLCTISEVFGPFAREEGKETPEGGDAAVSGQDSEDELPF